MSDDPYLSRIEDYLDEDLPASEMAELRAHVADCPECGAEVETYRRLRRLALAFPPVEVPDDLGFHIRRRLKEPMEATRRPRRVGRIVPLGWMAGVAAAAAILLVAILPDGGGTDPARPEPGVIRTTDFPEALSDWLVQAKNAAPEDLPMLVEEARELALLSGVRSRLADPEPDERDYLLSVEYVLVQIENDPSPEEFAGEAGLVAMARLP